MLRENTENMLDRWTIWKRVNREDIGRVCKCKSDKGELWQWECDREYESDSDAWVVLDRER